VKPSLNNFLVTVLTIWSAMGLVFFLAWPQKPEVTIKIKQVVEKIQISEYLSEGKCKREIEIPSVEGKLYAECE
jgi:hypothetical protein